MEPKTYTAKEYKLISLRDCTLTEKTRMCDTPEKAADYWREHIVSCPYFNAECECFVAMLLNTRRHVKGHQLISIGTLDTILVHPREVFRVAIVAGAAAIIVMHNHPSGDPTPSEADVKATRDLIRAGQLIKIEVLDHVILGRSTEERAKDWASLRELGYFY
jgi:DNA repair protein RadC